MMKCFTSKYRQFIGKGNIYFLIFCNVAKIGISGGSRISRRGCVNLVGGRRGLPKISKILYVKMKESGPLGACVGHAPSRSVNGNGILNSLLPVTRLFVMQSVMPDHQLRFCIIRLGSLSLSRLGKHGIILNLEPIPIS